jgi:quercetin dioxygenase-like cupin family protein
MDAVKAVRLTAGVTRKGEGLQGVVWNILGQTYTPKLCSERTFVWEAILPDGTFVPPHIHPTQDEYLWVLEGRFDLILDGQPSVAEAGDMIRLPMNIMHGIYNKSGATNRAIFGVAPTRRLWELFTRLHNLTDVDEVVRLSAEHEVNFLPPPPE